MCLLLIGESLCEYIDQYTEVRYWIYLWWEKSNFFGVDETIQFLKVKTKILKDLKKQVFKLVLFSCSSLRGSFSYILKKLPYNQQKRIHFSLYCYFFPNWKGDVFGVFYLSHVLHDPHVKQMITETIWHEIGGSVLSFSQEMKAKTYLPWNLAVSKYILFYKSYLFFKTLLI